VFVFYEDVCLVSSTGNFLEPMKQTFHIL